MQGAPWSQVKESKERQREMIIIPIVLTALAVFGIAGAVVIEKKTFERRKVRARRANGQYAPGYVTVNMFRREPDGSMTGVNMDQYYNSIILVCAGAVFTWLLHLGVI
jgi:hypothetical protein